MKIDRASVAEQKEKTLRTAWLVSLWAPLGTGVALILGRSTVLLADWLRRSSELLALFLAWWIYRKVQKGSDEHYNYGYGKMESLASLFVATVMLFSFMVIMYTASLRLLRPLPLGWVAPGLFIASAGALVNLWFWRRIYRLALQESTPLVEAQWRLYRAKTLIDLTVIFSLTLSSFLRDVPSAIYIDPISSLLIAFFLLYSAVKIAKSAFVDLLDKSFNHLVLNAVKEELRCVKGQRLSQVRSRSAGGQLYLTLSCVFDTNLTLEQITSTISDITHRLKKRFPRSMITVLVANDLDSLNQHNE